MAQALISNSFHLAASSPLSKPKSKLTKRPSVICAKQPAAGEESSQADQGTTGKKKFSFNFDFDFAKIPLDTKTLIPVVSNPTTALFASSRRKDPKTVFVAGATGQAGIRITQKLLREGYTVRAGVPDLGDAQDLARLAATYKIISPEESRRLNAVESAFSDAESIAKAIGPAAKVVVTIGSSENGPSGEVSTDDALQVVRAANLSGVGHVAIIYDSTSTFTGSTYNVLDGITSFFSNISNLFNQSQQLTIAELLAKIVETDVAYTIIKTSLTDDYASEGSYELVVSKERAGSSSSSTAEDEFKVPRDRIASLVTDVFSNTSIAENKVVEVSTSPSAPLKTAAELFSAIPEDGRRKEYAEALAKAKAEEEALLASERAREAAVAAKKLEEEVKKLSDQEAMAASLAEEARERAEAAQSSVEDLLSKAKNFSGGFSWDKLSSQLSTAVAQTTNGKPPAQIATVRGEAKARKLPPQKAVVKQPALKVTFEQPEQKPEVKNLFGGLFKQETIYVDDD